MTTSAWVRRGLLVLWLLCVWLLLWGTWSPAVLLGGTVVALAAVRWSRLPAPPLRTRVRWSRASLLLLRLGGDMLRASWAVAVASVRGADRTRSSVLRLHLRPDASDVAVVLACNRISLEPGSVVVDIDRHHDRLYVYVLDTPDTDAVERRRAESQRLLDAVLDAFPSRAGATRHGVGVVGDGRGS